MASRPTTQKAGRSDARSRLRTAGAYLEVADLVLAEQDRAEFLNVAAGLAVLGGISASDAICAARLGEIHRGDDHRGAAGLLARATSDGRKLAATFLRLIDVKDAAHYGVRTIRPVQAANAVRWAQTLVDRAREEAER